jgi:signal transduction histidine kinase
MFAYNEPDVVLGMVAHEIREPLAVIRAYVSMLYDDVLTDVLRSEALELIDRKAREADALVDTILLSARLESRRPGRVPASVDVAQVIVRAAAEVGPRAVREGASIRVDESVAPVAVQADPDHVSRVLVNLLNNALSYSARPAHVSVAIRRADPVEVVVSDRGTGIAAADHGRIFQPFERAAGAAQRLVAGLGLGLSISRRLAELNGGSLVLERSAPGRGSVFVLRLPRAWQ